MNTNPKKDRRFAFALMVSLVSPLIACHTPMESRHLTRDVVTWSDAVETKRVRPTPTTKSRARKVPLSAARDPLSFMNADDCEWHAQEAIDVDETVAWKRLVGCTTRRDFVFLRRLLRPPWIDVVRERNDASLVLAKVIAARGGNVKDDLKLVRSSRVAMFPFSAALVTPAFYSGRLLLLRGRVVEGRQSSRGAELHIEETVRVSHVVKHGRRRERQEQIEVEGVGGKWTGGNYSRSTKRTASSGDVGVYDVFHSSEETGRDFIGVMNRANPFLVAGPDFVFLIRFQGATERVGDSHGEVVDTGLGSIVAFYEAAHVRVD